MVAGAVAAALVATVCVVPAASAHDESDRTTWTDAQRREHGHELEKPVPDVAPLRSDAAPVVDRTVAPLAPAQRASVRWPDRSHATARVGRQHTAAWSGTPGGLPITVSGYGLAPRVDGDGAEVGVTVADHDAATHAGVEGVVFDLEPTDVGVAGKVDVSVDYSDFAGAYGGDWSSRLRLVRLPDCALTTPDKAACRTQTPVSGSTNDTASQTVTATVATASMGVMALAATASGSSGDWSATPLSASAAWQVSNQTGDFTWSYPLSVPATQGGPSPDLAISYDSGSVDGKVATTNNQTSWIGDGWDMDAGYVERKYASCADDSTSSGANNAGHKTGDLCWKTDNATLVFGGKAVELVQDGTSDVWHPKDDDGTLVKHLTGAANGDDDHEYWEVITTDGTQYFFGEDQRPTDSAALNSAWTVPVYGNNAGEPCHATAFADSWCQQAWRWNLDYVVDTAGNTMTYKYAKETNYYGRNLNEAVSSYVRGGYLTGIDYGQRKGSETAAPAPQHVAFTVAERCLATDCSSLTSSTAASWPDVPFDLICSSSTTCATQTSPSFFTRKRLTTVTTQVYSGGAYKDVDSWALTQSFPDPGDGSNAVLWLAKIVHTGKSNGSVALPAVTFSGTQMPNRVDDTGDYGPQMYRYRVSGVTTEAGGTVTVNYSAPDCTTSDHPSTSAEGQDSNTRMCYPVVWDPEGSGGPRVEYFHKYVVTALIQYGGDATSLPVETDYDYVGSPAWHYDDNELVPVAQRTWSEFRGYGTVDVVTGSTGIANREKVRYRYFRGMDGDHQADGTSRSAQVDGIDDADRYNGFLREQITYNGSAVVSDTFNTPWRSAATSTAPDGTKSYLLGVGTTETHTTAPALSGGERVTKTVTTYDSTYGTPLTVDDIGDVSTTSDDRCTTNEYARNTSANIVTTIKRSYTLGVRCANVDTATYPGDVISDTRTVYDGGAYGATPTKGLVTSTQEASSYSGSTGSYVTTSTTTYDADGRPTSTTDALGRKTTTAYTPATGGPVTQTTVTSPDPDGTGALTAQTTTTVLDPLRGVPTKSTDPAGKVTTATYDGLGRITAVWKPGRATTASASVKYAYKVGAGDNAVTTSTLNQDGATYLSSVTISDGLLRERQTQAPGANRDTGGRLVTDKFYDSRGLLTKANNAWPTTGSPSATVVTTPDSIPSRDLYTYDGAGRQTADVFQDDEVDRWKTTTSYGGDRTTVTPPSGGTPTTTVTDARGSTTKEIEYTAGSTTGASQTTTYSYDHGGRLVSMKDPAGNTWSYTYDVRGRQISAKDPDKGTTTTTYDNAGQVTSTKDARGKTLWYGYDALGRKTEERDTSATGAVLAKWTYDTLAKGQLTSSTSYVGSNAYTTAVTGYDNAYQPLGQSVTLPASEGKLAGTYTTTYAYALDEQLQSVSLPAGGGLGAEKVTTYYDKLNRPEWMGGPYGWGAYVAEDTYSSYGEMLSMDLSNSYVDQLTYTYDQASRRMTSQALWLENATGEVLHITYGYDDAGNVTSVADKPTVAGSKADTQCFTYDGLRRLVQAWTPSSNSCAGAASVLGLGGAAPYWSSWGYDAVGNRTSQTTHASGGDTVAAYTYPVAGSARPHGVTGINTTGPSGTTTSSSFGYDAAGNMSSRAMAGSTAQTLTWDTRGELSDVKAGATSQDASVYDADGNRLVRRQGTSVTAYLPGGEELTLNTSTQTLSAKRYYSFAGQTVAVRTGTGLAGVSTLVSDPQGTALVSIANGTNVVSRRYTDPFGNVRGAKPAWPGDHAMLDKVLDASGLTQVGARYLDTVTGRFVSVDPVLDTANPQQWNAYAYAGNNPVTFSDPSGLIITNPHPDGMTDKQWDNASHGRPAGPGTAPAQPSSASNSHYKAHTVRAPVHVTISSYATGGSPITSGGGKKSNGHHSPTHTTAPAPTSSGYPACANVCGQSSPYGGMIAIGVIFVAGGWVACLAASEVCVSALVVGAVKEAPDAVEVTSRLASRADELSGALDRIAQSRRTSAVLSTDEGADVLAGGGRDLSGAQKALAKAGDVIAKSPGDHAEVTAVNEALGQGLAPQGIAASRPFCPTCQAFLEDHGATILSPRTAWWYGGN
ncbi:hypothetical protein KDY119_03724 [Luteimicrobium xylanilyticum]|uniref:Teneurin-like YD-shell domain-containing protein n=1 Tax=Luteimicrobium xylanilyticum TaxID=1133546 RepID=A0A5P9QFA9_9MICO|nr:hypothetical protein KDY119_03724 [Luteimicrobium xylanilyticum]